MNVIDVDVMVKSAVRIMQLAKRSAKIFPEGVSEMEVYSHLLSTGKHLGFTDIRESFDRLKASNDIRVYPTMHDRRAMLTI